MSNSSLIYYTKLSPYHSGKRTHTIDRITPHCYVGQVTVQQAGEWFQKSGSSCNYVIGRDGNIGLIVDEVFRSWCSSSNENDQRAVTIECASDTKDPYAMNDSVYGSLVNLCVDICKRNGKKKLLWFEDKNKTLNYKPKDDEMVITVHRWFKSKACPGDWLYARLGDLANRVTAILEAETREIKEENPTAEQQILDTESLIWNYFKSKGLNDFAVAGIMGNLYAESGLRPNNLQNGFEKKLGMSDIEYTQAINNGTYSKDQFVYDKAGYGLAQWTYWSRKQGLYENVKNCNVEIDNLNIQLDFLWYELQTSYKGVLNALNSAKSVFEASNIMLLQFERPADQSEAVQNRRKSYSDMYYNKYAVKADKLYRVQIGAFLLKSNAGKQLEKVKEQGFDAFVTKIGLYYKVQVGAFSKKENAENMKNKVKSKGFDAIIVST